MGSSGGGGTFLRIVSGPLFLGTEERNGKPTRVTECERGVELTLLQKNVNEARMRSTEDLIGTKHVL